MARQIYKVYKDIIDKNGVYSGAGGYPKTFDSESYEGNTAIAKFRATGAFASAWADMCNSYNLNDHPIMQSITLVELPGRVIDCKTIGEVANPAPEPEPEEEEEETEPEEPVEP